jgi:dihydropyrimidinase
MKKLALCSVVLSIATAAAQSSPELVVRGGLVVTADGRREADLRIRNGVVAEIGRNLASAAGAQEIDARGKLVLPGGIDPHSHMADPPDGRVLETYTSGSAAALAGGVTSASNFLSKPAAESVTAFLDRNAALVERTAIADFFIHVNVTDPAWLTPDALSTLADRGVSSTKTFLSQPYFDRQATAYVTAFRLSGAAGVLSMVHCEDAAILGDLGPLMVSEGRGGLHNYAASRPDAIELAATHRAIAIAEVTGAPLYVVHISSARVLRALEEAKSRGVPVYVETRPLYLHLTQERFLQPDVALYLGSPPLREKSDQDALWEGIARGTIDTVATDHGARLKAEKLEPKFDVVTGGGGINVLQVYLPMLYAAGVRTGRITLERFVAVTSTNAAKIFGMYPRKGTIEVGSDADVVIWDPNLRRTIREQDELSNAKWNIYAGREVTGWPTVTIRRGEVVYRDGRVVGQPGTGRLIPQGRWKKPGPALR